MQAKDIPAADILSAIQCVQQRRNPSWRVSRWDIAEELSGEIPEKVLLAKLRGLVKRGVLTGCGCGCRGDFSIVEDWTPLPPPPAPSGGRDE